MRYGTVVGSDGLFGGREEVGVGGGRCGLVHLLLVVKVRPTESHKTQSHTSLEVTYNQQTL